MHKEIRKNTNCTSNLIAARHSLLSLIISNILLLFFIFIFGLTTSHSQTVYQPNYSVGNQQNNNYLANSSTFKQEIARMEINVVHLGQSSLPISQVPRLEKDDVLKVRLLEEQVNGMKPDQSNFDWTFLVAFINPGRNNEKERLVSEEVNFKKRGWYKEYSFVVPYDSQPIFFLYPKPNYRDKILDLINKNQEEIRKIGEKTIELSDAYAKIGSFLNELQFVINKSQYNGVYGNYGGYGVNNTYGNYGIYGNTTNTGFNSSLLMEQSIERLAESFNIQLPSCWQNGSIGYGNNNIYGANTNINPYNNYGGYNNYGYNNYGMRNDFLSRAQCVVKSVRLEDFDISVSRLLQQGGILAVSQLAQKYPQIAFWINIAAAALDIIIKITKKTPLKIVPTVISTTETPIQNFNLQTNSRNQQNFAYQNNNSNLNQEPLSNNPSSTSIKISLFAEAPPNDNNFVTAYPLVVHKWQADPDPEVISLPIPILSDQCLHTGQNLLRSTDLLNDWMSDNFTKDFKLLVSSPNGFRKEFPLKKNQGLGGWELNITREDLNAFPKINMTIESIITGKRGFKEVRSPKFELPIPNGGSWEITPESQKSFSVGGKRIVTLRNQYSSCRCLQAVVYKPSFGGQFVYESNARENKLQFSDDGKEVSFEVDANNFQPGQGLLELREYGGEITNLNINLYPSLPRITNLMISKGDKQAVIIGERLEQINAIKINGNRAVAVEGSTNLNTNNQSKNSNTYQGVNNNPNNQSVYSNIYQGNNSVNIQSLYPNNQGSNISTPLNNQTTYSNVYQGNKSVNTQSNYPNISQGNTLNTPNNSQSNYPNTYSGNNSINNQNPNSSIPNSINNSSLNEKTFIFEDPKVRQDSNTASLELDLGNNRYIYSGMFNVSLAKPTIVMSEDKLVEGIVIENNKTKPAFEITNLPIFLINTSEILANIQNALTDYDFKVENIQIETRIENSQISPSELPKTNFEVLDWKNMQIKFQLNEQSQRLLGGRRLQFRILDKERGNSDWFTLRNTFVRFPENISVKCSNAMKNCEMTAKGVDYISQVSVDGGKIWQQQQLSTAIKQSTPNEERKVLMIPYFTNKKLLRIRLRDFSVNEGIVVSNYTYINSSNGK